MQTKIIHVLRNLCDLKPGDTLLVGVSGGPDSITLLDLLSKLDFHLRFEQARLFRLKHQQIDLVVSLLLNQVLMVLLVMEKLPYVQFLFATMYP